MSSRRRRLRWGPCAALLAAALAANAGCAASGPHFSRTLPDGVPKLAGWEKSEARAELDNPPRVIEYQLFVRPGREVAYEVIRYRLRYADARLGERLGETPNERLQWDLNGRTLRRFELVPTAQGQRWEELAAGTPRYAHETWVILALLGLHRQLLFQREGIR